MNGNYWQRVEERVITNDNNWQRVRANDSEWLFRLKFFFFPAKRCWFEYLKTERLFLLTKLEVTGNSSSRCIQNHLLDLPHACLCIKDPRVLYKRYTQMTTQHCEMRDTSAVYVLFFSFFLFYSFLFKFVDKLYLGSFRLQTLVWNFRNQVFHIWKNTCKR